MHDTQYTGKGNKGKKYSMKALFPIISKGHLSKYTYRKELTENKNTLTLNRENALKFIHGKKVMYSDRY